MVVNSKIYKTLKKNIGQYLYGFERNQLDVSLLSGRIELVNVNFRPDKVNDLLASYGLPVHIKAGLIGKLKFKCNFLDPFGSAIEVELDELLLVFGSISQIYKEQFMNQENDSDIQTWLNNRENEILNFGKGKPGSWASQPIDMERRIRRMKRKKKENQEDDGSDTDPVVQFERLKRKKLTIRDESILEDPDKPGLLDQYLIKVLKNLILTVKTVHISYEDESYPFENPFSIGISIEKLELKPTSQEWQVLDGKITKQRSSSKSSIKELTLSNFSSYIYSMASVVIPTSLYESTLTSKIGIFEAFPASDVRNFIIHQSKLLSKSHPSTFIDPCSAKFCLSLSEDLPNFKVSGLTESISINFTPAMAECLRNFRDYSQNVKIWPLVSKYRPEQRIPPRPEKREHRKERRKRREIVRSWFSYAFQFVKVKRAALRFVKERNKERGFIKNMENQAKIKEKISLKKSEVVESKPEPPSPVETSSAFSSLFGLARKKPTAQVGLKSLIDSVTNKKPGKRPYDGEKYFPSYLINSDLDFLVASFRLKVFDEETGTQLELKSNDIIAKASTLLDELNFVFTIQDFLLSLKGQNKEIEVVKAGNKGKKDSDFGAKLKISYRPAEILIPGDPYPTLNMYETCLELGTFATSYSHNLINQLFALKESLSLSRVFRNNVNLEFIKSLMKNIKRRKIAKVFGSDIKKYAAFKKLGLQLADFQQWIEEKIVEFNNTFLSILFSAEVKTNTGEIAFHDFSPNTLMSLSVPQSCFSLGKNKESAYLTAFGITLKSPSTPAGIYDFLTTLGNLLCEHLKKMHKFTSYKRIN
jgi:hypothetical protein